MNVTTSFKEGFLFPVRYEGSDLNDGDKYTNDHTSYLTCGSVNKEYPLTSVCMSSTISDNLESPNASMSINFLILEPNEKNSIDHIIWLN